MNGSQRKHLFCVDSSNCCKSGIEVWRRINDCKEQNDSLINEQNGVTIECDTANEIGSSEIEENTQLKMLKVSYLKCMAHIKDIFDGNGEDACTTMVDRNLVDEIEDNGFIFQKVCI